MLPKGLIKLMRPQPGTFPSLRFRLFITALLLSLYAALPVSATTTYSDSWIDGSHPDAAYIVGFGLTEANVGDDWELHAVRATTTLRSPNGRTITRTAAVYYSWSTGSSFTARVEPTLMFDPNDMGDYIISTRHYSTCPATELGLTSALLALSYSRNVLHRVNNSDFYFINDDCVSRCPLDEFYSSYDRGECILVRVPIVTSKGNCIYLKHLYLVTDNVSCSTECDGVRAWIPKKPEPVYSAVRMKNLSDQSP